MYEWLHNRPQVLFCYKYINTSNKSTFISNLY